MSDLAIDPQATGETPLDSFSGWREKRGAAQPAESIKSEETTVSSTAAAEPAEGSAKSAPESAPVESERTKFEKRVAEKQRRIDDLTRQEKDLERRIAKINTSALPSPGARSAEAGLESPASAPAAVQQESETSDPRPRKPQQDQYKDWQQFETDMETWREQTAAWAARAEYRKMETQQSQREARSESERVYREALSLFEDRGAAYAGKYPEYMDLVRQFKDKSISDQVAACILEAENGPEILHFLMDNPKDLKEIEDLKFAAKRIDAIYALKYRLLGAAAPAEPPPAPEPRKSAAPAPGTRLNGTGGIGSKEPVTFQQFRHHRFSH